SILKTQIVLLPVELLFNNFEDADHFTCLGPATATLRIWFFNESIQHGEDQLYFCRSSWR
ncbi:unnamed protein product, partial [Amoebophrya sp. A120]